MRIDLSEHGVVDRSVRATSTDAGPPGLGIQIGLDEAVASQVVRRG